MSAVAIVPAAGASSRFGSMKLVADVGGQPMLARTLASVFDAGIARAVVVVAPHHALDGLVCLADPRVTLVTNPDPSRGMFSSIQVGLEAAEADSILVLPADMPFVPSDVIARVVQASSASGRTTVPTYDGQRGHPIVIPGKRVAALREQPAETSLKHAILATEGTAPAELPVNDPGVLRDVDVPQDLGSSNF